LLNFCHYNKFIAININKKSWFFSYIFYNFNGKKIVKNVLKSCFFCRGMLCSFFDDEKYQKSFRTRNALGNSILLKLTHFIIMYILRYVISFIRTLTFRNPLIQFWSISSVRYYVSCFSFVFLFVFSGTKLSKM